MVLLATGITVMWAGLTLGNPDIGRELRPLVYAETPIQVRVAQINEVYERSFGGPFLAFFAIAIVLWLYTAGWCLVAILAFRDVWRISWLRSVAILILTAGVLFLGGAFIVFAGTL